MKRIDVGLFDAFAGVTEIKPDGFPPLWRFKSLPLVIWLSGETMLVWRGHRR